MLDRKQKKQLAEKLLKMDWNYSYNFSAYKTKIITIENRIFTIQFESYLGEDDFNYNKAEFKEENGKQVDIKFMIPESLAKKIKDIAYAKFKEECKKAEEEQLKLIKKREEETEEKLKQFLGE